MPTFDFTYLLVAKLLVVLCLFLAVLSFKVLLFLFCWSVFCLVLVLWSVASQ